MVLCLEVNKMKYDFDNLHIEIDNVAAAMNLDAWTALEIWHLGCEAWRKRTEHSVAADNEDLCPNCGINIASYWGIVQKKRDIVHRR